MAQAYETRHRRNGAIDIREDVTTLQKDLSQLSGDIGNLITLQWNGFGERVNGGLDRVGKQVRARPIAAVGVAAGVGLLAGVALSMLNRRAR